VVAAPPVAASVMKAVLSALQLARNARMRTLATPQAFMVERRRSAGNGRWNGFNASREAQSGQRPAKGGAGEYRTAVACGCKVGG